MENRKDPLLDPEDDLKSENNLLKLKLEVDHGMMHMDNISGLTPELENQWLKSVYAFEEQFKHAKPTKVYDYIGRPPFKKWDKLKDDEIPTELNRVLALMQKHQLELDCLCDYDEAIIYRFITEELFEHEMGGMSIPGMTWHFIYEEFHPNHEYDIRREITSFVNAIFTRPWDEKYDCTAFSRKVLFSDTAYDRAEMASIIKVFQEAHVDLSTTDFEIGTINIDKGATRATVHAGLSWSGKMRQGEIFRHEGICTFHVEREHDYWFIAKFHIPGFTRQQ